MRHVAQLAPRHENGTGAELSSQMSTSRPPAGSSTVMAAPASLASNTIFGMDGRSMHAGDAVTSSLRA